MKDDKTIRVPIVARMRKNEATGKFEIVREKSIYADIPADYIARWLLERFNVPVKAKEEVET